MNLSLTSIEDDALERLAYISGCGRDKQKYLISLINNQYAKLDQGCVLVDNELISVTDIAELPDMIFNKEVLEDDRITDIEFCIILLKAYRACKYAQKSSYGVEVQEVYDRILSVLNTRLDNQLEVGGIIIS